MISIRQFAERERESVCVWRLTKRHSTCSMEREREREEYGDRTTEYIERWHGDF